MTNPHAAAPEESKHPFLVLLGQRVSSLRARRGLTRKALAAAAQVSERHLANMEYGLGNASVLVLLQVANALQSSLGELLGDEVSALPDALMIRQMLADCDPPDLHRVRLAIAQVLGSPADGQAPSQRIALVGLRGAGKSALGQLLAQDLGYPFIELSRSIENFAGCSVGEIQALYGANAYRRYERRALEECLQTHEQAVIATPGGLVTDPARFNLLLARCSTVWLQAEPLDHLRRVTAQGDMRPMAASKEALQDLQGILDGRKPFYSKAPMALNTSTQDLATTFSALRTMVRQYLRQAD